MQCAVYIIKTVVNSALLFFYSYDYEKSIQINIR